MRIPLKGDEIKGQDINKVRTLKSWYDHDCVEVMVGEKIFRMPNSTISQMLDEFIFTIEKKAKHTYLTNAIPLDTLSEGQLKELFHKGGTK